MQLARARRPSEPRSARAGLSATGTLTLVAIVSLVILVSLPRLHGFALAENERDAVLTVRRLAPDVQRLVGSDGNPTIGALVDLVTPARLEHELADAELIDGGTLLRRHGYLFQLVRAAPPRPTDGVLAAGPLHPELLLVAWPWRAGETGWQAVVGSSDGVLRASPNPSARWSGRRRPPEPPWSGTGWRELR